MSSRSPPNCCARRTRSIYVVPFVCPIQPTLRVGPGWIFEEMTMEAVAVSPLQGEPEPRPVERNVLKEPLDSVRDGVPVFSDRSGPLGRPLEDGEGFCLEGDIRNELHCTGTSPYYAHRLTAQINVEPPAGGVKDRPFELVTPLNERNVWSFSCPTAAKIALDLYVERAPSTASQ